MVRLKVKKTSDEELSIMISIPYGAIKSELLEYKELKKKVFQFLMVRLKVYI